MPDFETVCVDITRNIKKEWSEKERKAHCADACEYVATQKEKQRIEHLIKASGKAYNETADYDPADVYRGERQRQNQRRTFF